jgi:Tol biopolymer transport system component
MLLLRVAERSGHRDAPASRSEIMPRRITRALAGGLAMAMALGTGLPAWGQGAIERISVGSNGVQGDRDSFFPKLSADGRFVAFGSLAGSLVPGDTNGATDVFVRDRRTGITERVSLGPGGSQGNGDSGSPALSADGRFVALISEAGNLVPGDTNGATDVFVRDRRTGATARVSLGPNGVQGDGDSYYPALSASGRFIAFASNAGNLVPDDTNGAWDVFVRDRRTGITERVSLRPDGVQANSHSLRPALSADGRFVAFESFAGNLVPGDTNRTNDVFVRDRRTGTTERVSVRTGGAQGNNSSTSPALSAGGRFVAFWSSANLVPGDTNSTNDVFVRDRRTGRTERVSLGPNGAQSNGPSYSPALSAGGRFVAFESEASNLVPGDTNGAWDVFVHTRAGGR